MPVLMFTREQLMRSAEQSRANGCDDTKDGGSDAGSDQSIDDYPLGVFGTVIIDCPRPVQLHTGSKARREAKQRSAAVLERWRTLRDVIQRHEGVLHRRWSNKSKGQKLNILLKAWPGMALTHRPDLDAYRKESPEQRAVGTAFKEAYLWPYINQEDLSKNGALQLFLNARGRHPPSAFAAADMDAAAFGLLVSDALIPKFLVGYTVILSGVTESNIDDYGKIVGWHTHPGAAHLYATEHEFEPGEGLLVLEIQERLYSFLVDCCKEILHDYPADSWTSDAFPIQPEPKIKSGAELTGFESLAVMAAEAPYRVPAKLDLGKIISLLTARTAAAEDRLWALREDPLFLRDQILEAKDHLPHQLENASAEPLPEAILWLLATTFVIREAFVQLELFSDLRQQAEWLQALQIRYASVISPKEDLPDEYLDAILSFWLCLESSAGGRLENLQIAAAASIPLRRFFVDAAPLQMMQRSPGKVMLRLKPEALRTRAEHSLVWLLGFLADNSHDLIMTATGVDELQRLVEADPEVSRLLTPFNATLFGDVSILAQCLRQINLYHPWARRFPRRLDEDLAKVEELKSAVDAKSKSSLDFLAELHVQNFTAAAKVAAPFERRFPYPIEKRRTKENVAALREAERNLDAFWDCIDRIIQKKAGNLDGTATRRPPTSNPQDVVYKPLSTVYFSLEPSPAPQAASLPSGRGRKTKTRGTPRPPAVNNTPLTPTPTTTSPPAPAPSSISVDARALKVFRVLFHNPDVTSIPGEVSWTDFLHAMASTGFEAQKLCGSGWQFRPTRPDMKNPNPIQFHEPHPKGKLQYRDARRYGRRLQRAYGWCGAMFVLKEK